MQLQKVMPRLDVPIPHLRLGEPLPRPDDGTPRSLTALLDQHQKFYKLINHIEWHLLLRASLLIQVQCRL